MIYLNPPRPLLEVRKLVETWLHRLTPLRFAIMLRYSVKDTLHSSYTTEFNCILTVWNVRHF